MKTALAWLFAFCLYVGVAMALQSCATAKGTNVIRDCASEALPQIEGNLTGTIGAILESGNYESALLGLVAQLGSDGLTIVNCIVTKIATTHAEMIPDVRAHAHEWLRLHGESR
jgi:hypothetical protein